MHRVLVGTIAVLAVLSVCALGCRTDEYQRVRIGSDRVIYGFVSSEDMGILSQISLKRLTHLAYTAIQVTSATDPTLRMLDGSWSNIDTVVLAAHAKGVKAIINLYDTGNLVNICGSSILRAQLVSNITNLLKTGNLDGVEIDWEMDIWTPNYTILADRLVYDLYSSFKNTFPNHKLIFAVGNYDSVSFDPNVAPQFIVSLDAAQYVDYFDLDSYYGPAHPHGFSDLYYTTAFVESWIYAGYPRSKLLMGIFANAISSEFSSKCTYADIVNAGYDPNLDQAYISTIYSRFDGSVITVNNTLYWNGPGKVEQKADWTINNGIGGTSLFAVGHDELRNASSLLRTIFDQYSLSSLTPTPPSVTTNATSNVSGTGATLNGTLSDLGSANSATVSFQYGTTASYGSTALAHTLTASGAFSANVTGLTPGTTYHFRSVASGSSIVYGNDVTFATSVR